MSKQTEGKYKPSLTYTSMLEIVSHVREYGISKYGNSENWLTTNPMDHLNAAIRHIRKHIEGEIYDNDSNLLHLAHAVTNLMFEIERMKRENTSQGPTSIDTAVLLSEGFKK